jgi:nucleotide-binding universal stress UspA family protein
LTWISLGKKRKWHLSGGKPQCMKRILVPCDFSPAAQQAYNFALAVAKKSRGEIFVLRVIDLPFMYESYSPDVPLYLNPKSWKHIEHEAMERFKRMMKIRGSHPEVTFRVIQGPVTTSILDFIQKEKIDLVVMGTKGATGLDGYLIGSNTEKIVRLSKVPVLAIHRATKLSGKTKIVVPISLEPRQEKFIEKLKELQALLGASLHFVVVNTPHNMKRAINQHKQMEEYVREFKIGHYTLNVQNDFNEEAGILQFVKKKKADMIAMATHGRRGLGHLFMGSVAEDLVNHASLPIWTYSIRK